MIITLAICKRSIFIQGVQPFLLLQNIQFTGICNNSAEGLAQYQAKKPDVVLMDANWGYLPYAIPGDDLIRSLIGFDPGVRIIAATSTFEPMLIEKLKDMGAMGYIYKNSRDALNEIITCINKVYAGEEYFCKRII